jgi:hypothetical protein
MNFQEVDVLFRYYRLGVLVNLWRESLASDGAGFCCFYLIFKEM